jgi:E1-E2 ATPase
MSQTIHITSYVKGPVRVGGRDRAPALPWAFRISDPDLYDSLRQSRDHDCHADRTFYQLEAIDPAYIKVGDLLLVENGQIICADGVVRKGCALVDESAVTGDSTYVLRESGGRDRVMRDTLVVSGAIVVEVAPRLGHALDWIAKSKSASNDRVGRPFVPTTVMPASEQVKTSGPRECAGK